MPILNGRILDRLRNLPISRQPPYRIPVEPSGSQSNPVKAGPAEPAPFRGKTPDGPEPPRKLVICA